MQPDEPVPTDERAAQTNIVDTPAIVESTIAESEITGTEPPEEPHISDVPTIPLVPPKREFHFNWWSLIALALVLFLAGEHIPTLIVPLVNSYLHPTATVTIFPMQKVLSRTYTLLAVTGTADRQHNQIPSRILGFTTPPQSFTVHTTGTGETPPVQAQGTVTFYNAAIYSQTIDAGTVITGGDGIQVITDESVTVAAGNPPYSYGTATVSAHSIQAGTRGNIQPLDMNGLCCLAGISVKNTSVFAGGADPKAYSMLSQADVDMATKQLAGSLDPQAKGALTNAIKPTEQLLTPITCTYHAVSHPNVGEKATQAQVSVAETCNVQVYDVAALREVISSHFLQDVRIQAGADFIPKGSIAIAIAKTSVLDSSHHTYSLTVRAQGTLIFHLSAGRLSSLAVQIAGKPLAQARTRLLELQGVQGVDIQPAGSTDTLLPTDPTHIQITVLTGS